MPGTVRVELRELMSSRSTEVLKLGKWVCPRLTCSSLQPLTQKQKKHQMVIMLQHIGEPFVLGSRQGLFCY